MNKIFHFFLMVGSIALMAICLLYPYLPGEYDGLAETLSLMVQVFGLVGMLLVPIGISWLGYELIRTRRKPHPPQKDRGYYFAIASLIAALFVVVAVSLMAAMNTGISFGVLIFAICSGIIIGLARKLRMLQNAGNRSFNPAPLYLILLPGAALFLQLLFAGIAVESSRNRAIAGSEELITLIEDYRTAYGHYPSSLMALNEDFKTSVVGIAQYHYAPNGDGYNLFFQQPRFLFPELGAREIVMYNRLNEHIMPSHAAWILASSPEELVNRQGWYAVYDASAPHWKYFLFD